MSTLSAGTIKAHGLRCEYLSNPLGIDQTKPGLSWKPEAATRGQKQMAYQILVASSPDNLAKDSGDLWDTGRVTSDQSIQVAYGGKPLSSRPPCYWKVRVWDKDDKASAWSESSERSMGPLESSNCKAAPPFSLPLPAPQGILRAR